MAAADKCQPTIIGMSALLTTTMTYMKTVIDGFEAAGRGHIKMAVGGAPISQMFADEIGADGYGAERVGGRRPVPAAGQASRRDADGHLQGPLLAGSPVADQGRGRRRRRHAAAADRVPGADRSRSPPSAGSGGSDDYLAQWRWSDDEERDGSAQDVAEAVRAELEAKAGFV